tara:strand:- start:1752 stop:2222 length:471 start_codon:yes stop_codon:yes gene_type:complete
MMKFSKAVVLASSLLATTASADTVDRVKVFDHTKTIVTQMPQSQTRCNKVQVPIYQDVQTQGNAAEGALLGMILGGLAGKGVTGDDKGAAAGAIFGGLVGADKGGQVKTERRIVGYENRQQCNDVVVYVDQQEERYSHSTIRFHLNGERYVLRFQK